MNIIFDEYKYAENIIKNGFKSYLNSRDLYILAMYYRYIGCNDIQSREEIKLLCIKYFYQFNEVRSGDRLDSAISFSKEHDIKIFTSIKITNSELEKIKTAKNYKEEKILFIMLALNKYFEAGREKERHFVNKSYSDIFRLAKVYATAKEKQDTLYDLKIKGFIKVPDVYASFCKGKNNVEILYRIDLDEIGIDIVKEDLISFYPFYCVKCGKIIERKNNRQKLCNDCWQEKRKDDIKNNVQNYRNKNVIIQTI